MVISTATLLCDEVSVGIFQLAPICSGMSKYLLLK